MGRWQYTQGNQILLEDQRLQQIQKSYLAKIIWASVFKYVSLEKEKIQKHIVLVKLNYKLLVGEIQSFIQRSTQESYQTSSYQGDMHRGEWATKITKTFHVPARVVG